MIHTAFEFIKTYLSVLAESNNLVFSGVDIINNYLPLKTGAPNSATNELFITLLNIEEERSNKNPNIYQRKAGTDTFLEYNPEIILNLYVMFSGFSAIYTESLKNISRVITAFANKNVFTENDIRVMLNINEKSVLIPEKLILDLHNISLDQNNSLWQAMGTNVLPHVIYRVRTITIIPITKTGEITEVTEININTGNY